MFAFLIYLCNPQRHSSRSFFEIRERSAWSVLKGQCKFIPVPRQERKRSQGSLLLFESLTLLIHYRARVPL
uniref:Uncharacterized protein n=1 Tax=Utricularia reniformis TaxID=192314 RepID=A0A1Y0B344_9LAMI|nr:hypothetical protein AEK19_MT1670 [Utricularia reniformis]ART31852.1 hypothetical protein AEK19_MT1670 [Utricularia reniformis]